MEETREVAGTAGHLAEFARLLVGEPSVEDILEGLARYCTELLPLHSVGVLLRDENDALAVATANTPEGRAVEQLEVDLGEGPCTEALGRGERVQVPDLSGAAERYPRFVPAALELGVRSIAGVPMGVRGGAVGVLNLIALERVDLGPSELTTAQLLADVAVSYIENSQLLEQRTALAEQLQTALDSRIAIEQAKGVLSERHGVSLEEAFGRIRNHARSSQARVREVAERILDGGLEI